MIQPVNLSRYNFNEIKNTNYFMYTSIHIIVQIVKRINQISTREVLFSVTKQEIMLILLKALKV